ncbi:NUDIX hydrolase [Sporosarcina contaminans]|uniref:NUDIX hydrolase n=1 Tax=Sporosarcina contaminans TaxID=633403 RepID=A0ABW3U0T7_9BACL
MTDVPTKVMFDFACKPIGGELCTSEETSDVRWVPNENVLDIITSPAIRSRIQSFFDFDGAVEYMEYKTHPEFQLLPSRKV